MALPYSFCLVLNSDPTIFTLQDNMVYGGSNPARNTYGNVLIAELITSDGTETFLTVDSTPYTSNIAYTMTNSYDGHYHFELELFNTYSSGTTYNPETRDINNIIVTYANLIYYPNTQLFYKNILTSTGIAPDASNGSTYWTQILDFTDPEVRTNTTIQVGVYDTIATARSRICVKNALYAINRKDPSCYDVKTLLPYLKKAVLLMGAEAKNDDSDPEKAEIIIETLANLCPQC